MKEQKCHVEMGNTFFQSTVILFSPRNLLWGSKQQTECFTQDAKMTVHFHQSYQVLFQLSPAFPCTSSSSTVSM